MSVEATGRAGRRRLPRAALLVLAALAVAGWALMPSGAGAQDDAQELTELQNRLAELDGLIGEAEAERTDVAATIGSARAELAEADVVVELLGDEFVTTVEAREQPATLRQVAAIESYVFGDPRGQALLEELQTIGGDPEPGRRRELYDAAIEDAIDQVDSYDRRLRELADEVDDLRRSQADTRDDLAIAEARLVELDTDLDVWRGERELVVDRIDWIESLADRAVLTGLDVGGNPDRPAVVVKIDNVEAARPQVGLNEADVVYEEIVEGGYTRLAAIYHSRPSDPVGPVRSMRTSDIDLLTSLDRPLFVNSGGNPGVTGAVNDSPLVNVGHAEVGDLYYRASDRRAPHNLFTNVSEVWTLDRDTGRPGPLFRYRAPTEAPPAGETVEFVAIDYGSTSVIYTWNGSGWARTQDGTPHVDAFGTQVAPPNVVVQFIEYGLSFADIRSPEAQLLGSGEAWILTDGRLVRGSWVRETPELPTVYLDADGEPVLLEPGSTWVALPRAGAAATA